MDDDSQLLRRYVEGQSEPAFTELVGRYLNIVHSAALRQVGGDAHRAREVTQAVFTDLARKASSLSRHPALIGWLYTSTHFAAAKLARAEHRRRTHEQEAQAMHDILTSSEPAVDWERLRPVLDGALQNLSERERDAVLLRFFEQRPLAQVGEKLGVSENAARKSVERAIDKLRDALARRGVTSTTGALAVALAEQSVVAAPAGLLSTVSTAALSGAAAAGGSAGLLAFMSMTKLQLGFATAFAVAGMTGIVMQAESNTDLRRELAAIEQQERENQALRTENIRLAQIAAEVRDLRGDDAALAQLRDRIAMLKARSQEGARPAVTSASAGGDDLLGPSVVFDLTAVDEPPRIRFRTPAVYSAGLKGSAVPGEVLVEFIVDQDGNTTDVRAIKSSRPELEGPVIQAVKKWKYRPGKKDGQLVRVRLQQSIAFAKPAPPAKR